MRFKYHTAIAAVSIWPSTVASAAPRTPMGRKPRFPKISAQLSAILEITPATEAEAHVYEYLRLDGGKRMYLILVEGDPGKGFAFTFDGEEMTWHESYGAYVWLVVSEELPEGFTSGVSERLSGRLSEAAPTTETSDIPDSALIQVICGGRFEGFDEISMRMMLAMDVNGSHHVDILDAVAANYRAQTGGDGA